MPFAVGNDGVAKVPSVPEKAAIVPPGTVPPGDVSTFEELKVKSAVIVDIPCGRTADGETLPFNTRY